MPFFGEGDMVSVSSGTITHTIESVREMAERIAVLTEALVGLVQACDVDDVYEEDKSDRPAMQVARAAIRND